MIQPLVFDSSAMTALFHAYEPVYRMWEWAARGDVIIMLPAAAIAEANATLAATASAWTAILSPADVMPMALTEHVAIEIGPRPGSLATRHVAYEAAAVLGIIVTLTPAEYDGLDVQVFPV